VTNLRIRPLDPLSIPKPVRIEAEVSEGPRFKFLAFKFTGNSGISTEKLLAAFPLHSGEFFDAGKIRAGLGSLRTLYVSKGYLDVVPVPAIQKLADARIVLTFQITEGLQYRMGTLEIEGDSDSADQLRLNWELKPGEPYDATYLTKFLEANRSYLPAQFERDNDVAVLRDCRDMTVTVHIELEPKRGVRSPLQENGCQKDKSASK
jgi:outer membrane protein assembly factor BamA